MKHPKGLLAMKYDSRPIQESPHIVGENRPDGIRFVSGVEGNASYGPYCTLERGNYFCGFLVKGVDLPDAEQMFLIDAVGGLGGDVLGAKWFSSRDIYRETEALVGVEVKVPEQMTGVEVRLHFSGSGSLEIARKLIFRSDLA